MFDLCLGLRRFDLDVSSDVDVMEGSANGTTESLGSVEVFTRGDVDGPDFTDFCTRSFFIAGDKDMGIAPFSPFDLVLRGPPAFIVLIASVDLVLRGHLVLSGPPVQRGPPAPGVLLFTVVSTDAFFFVGRGAFSLRLKRCWSVMLDCRFLHVVHQLLMKTPNQCTTYWRFFHTKYRRAPNART